MGGRLRMGSREEGGLFRGQQRQKPGIILEAGVVIQGRGEASLAGVLAMEGRDLARF